MSVPGVIDPPVIYVGTCILSGSVDAVDSWRESYPVIEDGSSSFIEGMLVDGDNGVAAAR